MKKVNVPASELCRLCTVQGGSTMENIFSSSSTKHSLFTMIAAVTNLELKEGDGMPSRVCQQCIYQLKLSHKFKKRCLAADNALRVIYWKAVNIDKLNDPDPGSDGESYVDPLMDSSDVKIEVECDTPTHTNNTSNVDIFHQLKNEEMNKNKKELQPKSKLIKNHLKETKDNIEKEDYGEERYECDLCKRSYKSRKTIIIHLRLHSKRRRECTICDKFFATDTLLRKHNVTHSNDRIHTCQTCNKTFLARTTLVGHMLTHNLYSHKCLICSRPFKQARTLKAHMASHSNDRPYRCSMCSQAFKLKVTLYAHRRRHLRDRRKSNIAFECDICGEVFTKNDLLTAHVLKDHADDEELDAGCDAND